MRKQRVKGPLFTIMPDGSITSDRWLLTFREAAEAMGMSAAYLQRLSTPGSKERFEIEPIRVGRRVRFRLTDIIEYTKKA
jgi:predicted DNA-binding transcriptional regulator AlpA